MGDWNSPETAPLDGRPVLLHIETMPLHKKTFQDSDLKQPTRMVLARWSTWDHCWRVLPNGENVALPTYGDILGWQSVTPP